MDPRSWAAFKRQAKRAHIPYLHPGEYEAERARQEAHRQVEQAQLQADLERYRAEVDAGIEHRKPAPIETHLRDVVDREF